MFIRSLRSNILFAAAGAEGGAGGGSGEGSAKEPSGDDGATSVTKEWVEATVNKAVGSRFRDFEGKQTKAFSSLEGRFTEILTTLDSSLTEKITALGKGGDSGADKSKAAEHDVENHPKFKAMDRRMKELEDAAKVRNEELLAERGKVKDQALRTKLTESLARIKVDGERAEAAVKLIVDGDKLVSYAEDGESLIFKHEGEELNVEAGLKKWLESGVGKIFLPPRNASGSGDGPRGARGSPPASSNGSAPPLPSRTELGEAFIALQTGSR